MRGRRILMLWANDSHALCTFMIYVINELLGSGMIIIYYRYYPCTLFAKVTCIKKLIRKIKRDE